MLTRNVTAAATLFALASLSLAASERIARKFEEAAAEARKAASLHRNVSHKLTR